MLVDSQGNPEWVGASQHLGGGLQPWGHIKTVNQRPVLYPGERSHPTFLAPDTAGSVDELIPPDDNLEYLYQQQYLCDSNGGGFISPSKASGSGHQFR